MVNAGTWSRAKHIHTTHNNNRLLQHIHFERSRCWVEILVPRRKYTGMNSVRKRSSIGRWWHTCGSITSSICFYSHLSPQGIILVAGDTTRYTNNRIPLPSYLLPCCGRRVYLRLTMPFACFLHISHVTPRLPPSISLKLFERNAVLTKRHTHFPNTQPSSCSTATTSTRAGRNSLLSLHSTTRTMKLSMFLVLLPSVSAFVVTPATLLKQPPHHNRDSFRTAPPAAASSAGERRGSSSSSRMSMGPQQPRGEEGAWSITSFWREVMGTASETKAKVDSTVSSWQTNKERKLF